MTNLNALAAGQGGTESNNLAPKSQISAPHAPTEENPTDTREDQTAPSKACSDPAVNAEDTAAQHSPHDADQPEEQPLDDEAQRRRIADRLSQELDINVDLTAICEHLASIPKKGRIEAINAAAKLTHANAQLARSLAHLLKVERRQTTIVQHIQPRAAISNHSNASGAFTREDAALVDDLLTTMLRYMKRIADDELRPVVEQAARREKYDGHDEENSTSAA